jgi:hypothetical protein
MTDPLDPIRDLLARLTRERDEALTLAARLDRECDRMGRANNDLCDENYQLRAQLEELTGKAAE